MGEISTGEHGLGDAHHERRDDRTAEAAEAAEHDDRQQPRDQVVVAARVEREDDAVHGAGRGGGRDAEAEADRRATRCGSTPSSSAETGFWTVARTERPKRLRARIR